MTDATALLTTADGKPLKAALARSMRTRRRRALMLVLPLLLFILVTFLMPIGQMLFQSVYNPDFSVAAPSLHQWFKEHPQGSEIDEGAYAALAADLQHMAKEKLAGAAGQRMNFDVPGTRSLFTATARKAGDLAPPYKESLLAIDKKWSDPMIWRAMRSASSAYTGDFYLAAVDMTRDADGKIVKVDEKERVYVKLFVRTFGLSILITFICLVLAFPVAHLLATLPMAKSNLLMILVLLPFWTSLLVRTTSWIVLLGNEGVLKSALRGIGLLAHDTEGPQLIYNQTGTIVAMTHILLPFMILPLYSVMRTIDPRYVRAAKSLGATSWTAFRRVYLPLTLPGVGAGGLLVFILAIGYYITPALVGGAEGQLISNLIALHINKTLNWSLAASLSGLLLLAVLILYWLYDRLVGIDKLKLG